MEQELDTYVKVRKDEYDILVEQNKEMKNKLDFCNGRIDTLKETQIIQLKIISKLEKQQQDLKEWLEEEINYIDNELDKDSTEAIGKHSRCYKNVLERLG